MPWIHVIRPVLGPGLRQTGLDDGCLILGMIWCGVALQGLITQVGISTVLRAPIQHHFAACGIPPSILISGDP